MKDLVNIGLSKQWVRWKNNRKETMICRRMKEITKRKVNNEKKNGESKGEKKTAMNWQGSKTRCGGLDRRRGEASIKASPDSRFEMP